MRVGPVRGARRVRRFTAIPITAVPLTALMTTATVALLSSCTSADTTTALRSISVTTRSVDSTTSAPRPATTQSSAADSTTKPSPGTVLSADTGGPRANVDHWHSAYGVFDCDRYLDPIDATELPDPEGIHTHADGLIHIHPFTAAASGKGAVLRRFTDVAGITLTNERLSIVTPGVSIDRRTGDRCPNGRPGRVRVLLFGGPTHSDPVEVNDPLRLPLRPDQVIAIVFAPDDQLIGPPPSMSELDSPADLPVEFELTPERSALIGPEPKVAVPSGDKPTEMAIEDIELGVGDIVGETSKVGVKFVLAAWSSGSTVESNWQDTAPLLGLALGRNSVIKGFEQGMQGMRVGGLRRIVIPPQLGFGTLGSPPLVGPNETLVLYVRLVALESPRFSVAGTTVPS